jgi:prolyl 4-hydroxylase
MLKGGEQNRLITVFWYLSDVSKGGHTIFPLANGARGSSSSGDCDIPGKNIYNSIENQCQ